MSDESFLDTLFRSDDDAAGETPAADETSATDETPAADETAPADETPDPEQPGSGDPDPETPAPEGETPSPADALADVPARALTPDQARQVLAGLEASGALRTAPAATPAWVSLAEPVMHGVEFRYWDGRTSRRSALLNLDPRHAVALARLAERLATVHGAVTIKHLGVNGDSSGARTDCHGQGRALDFAGVTGTVDGADYDVDVLRDWGRRSVPDESDPSASRLPSWPAGTRDLTYRLESDPDVDQRVTDLFRDVYQVAVEQWQDLDDQPSPSGSASAIGQRSFVMNPDHPTSKPGTPNGREAHANHVHVQIGRTGRE